MLCGSCDGMGEDDELYGFMLGYGLAPAWLAVVKLLKFCFVTFLF